MTHLLPCLAELEVEFGDLLQEFQHVLEELRVNESGLARSCSRVGLGLESFLGCHVMDWRPVLGVSPPPPALRPVLPAKLGDTRDLQSFIENLDKELAGMLLKIFWKHIFFFFLC
uniref:Uncharacterized protein n=1 Tax=Scleropages formosus TaxID=113540 RepID=A0A8C9T0K1_SCLFO